MDYLGTNGLAYRSPVFAVAGNYYLIQFQYMFIAILGFFLVLLFYNRVAELGFSSFSIKLRDIDEARKDIYAKQEIVNQLAADIAAVASVVVTNTIHTNVIEHGTCITSEQLYKQEAARLRIRDNILHLHKASNTPETVIAEFVSNTNKLSSDFLARKLAGEIFGETVKMLQKQYSEKLITEDEFHTLDEMFSPEKIRSLVAQSPLTGATLIAQLESKSIMNPGIRSLLCEYSTFVQQHNIAAWIS